MLLLLMFAQQQTQSPASGLEGFLNYGVLGVLVILLVCGLLVPRYVMTQLRKDFDDLKEDYEELRKQIDEKIIPALIEATRALNAQDKG